MIRFKRIRRKTLPTGKSFSWEISYTPSAMRVSTVLRGLI
jgi:hypothetical protein